MAGEDRIYLKKPSTINKNCKQKTKIVNKNCKQKIKIATKIKAKNVF